ncbi:Uncharacterised protein [Yersinia mollaretii]|nr:Uncharacterised protein [Yersinia mollaretii]
MAKIAITMTLYIWLLSETNDSRKEKIHSSIIFPTAPPGA